MKYVVKQKFSQHPELRNLLLATQEEELISDNAGQEADRFWGVNNYVNEFNYDGENHLGRILMKERKEIKKELLKIGIERRLIHYLNGNLVTAENLYNEAGEGSGRWGAGAAHGRNWRQYLQSID